MDKDNIIRIILEGRDRLSQPFNNATRAIRNLRNEAKAAKDEFPLFGGGFASRGQGGQFERQLKQSEKLLQNFRTFRREFGTGFSLGKDFGRDIDEALKDFEKFKQGRLTEISQEHDQRRKFLREELREKSTSERLQIVQLEAEKDAIRRQSLSVYMTDEERLAITSAFRRAKAEKIEQIRGIKEVIREREKEAFASLTREFQARRAQVRTLSRADVANQAFAGMSRDVDRLDSSIARLGRSAGRSFGDFFRGVSLGKRGIKEVTDEVGKSGGVFTRFGLAVGDAVSSVDRFVNLRWLFITGIITLFFNVVVRLGAALVALASSASLAAAALGGALAAAITQLAPAAGLLAAAFKRVGVVLDAVKLADKNRISQANDLKEAMDRQREAAQRLADAQWTLKTASEGVGDAQFNLVDRNEALQKAIRDRADAIKELAKARKQAAQDIIDANLNEKEAALSLEEAELSLLEAHRKLREEEAKRRQRDVDVEGAGAALREAQERLRIAREQGDQAEISAAQQQVTIAQQNLNTIQDKAAELQENMKQAENAVKRAEINKEQAIIRDRRSREEAKKARKEGVEGSDVVIRAQKQLETSIEGVEDAQRQVVLANRSVRDSLHNVAIAQREVADARLAAADATKFQTTQQKNLQEALADLSPSEKKLFNSLKRIQAVYKKVFVGTSKKDGILGVINEAFSRAVDNATVLLQDPKLQKAAKNLASAIAAAIDTISDFALTPEFRNALEFFINEAAKNLPKLTEAFLNLFKAFIRVAKTATPIFDRLIDRFVGFTERIEVATRNQKKMDEFFGTAEKHLDSWIKFGKAVGNVLGALIGGAANSGATLLDNITNKLNEWADWLRENPEKVHEFFEEMRKSLENLSAVFGKFLPQFIKAFSSDEFTAFAQLMLEVVVPGLLLFIKALGQASKILVAFFDIPLVGDFAKFALTLLVAEKAANKLFPVTQRLTTLLNKGLIAGFRAFFLLIRNPQALFRQVITGLEGIRLRFMYLKDGAVKAAVGFKDATIKLIEFSKAFVALARSQGIMNALTATFPRLAAGIRLVGAALRFVFITNPWIAIVAAIIVAIVLLDRKFHFLAPTIRFIGRIFREVFDWIKKNWKLLVAILLAPFAATVFAIIKWRDKIIGFLGDVIGWVRKHWKLLVGIILSPFAIGGSLIIGFLKFKDKIIGVFGLIKTGIINIFKEAIAWVKEKVTGLAEWVGNKIKGIPIIGKFIGGGKQASPEGIAKVSNAVLADPSLDRVRKKIKAFRKQELKAEDIIESLLASGDLDEKTLKKLVEKHSDLFFASGGSIPGGLGQAVPIVAHAGEWVLNMKQQRLLASRTGMTSQQLAAFIFGTNIGSVKPGPTTTGTRPSKSLSPTKFNKYTLIPQTDEDDNTVWFIELADKTFGQVTARDAKRIQESNGNYIPGYVKRSKAGFNIDRGGFRPFSLGGIISAPAIQRFAQGGVVQSPGFGGMRINKGGNTVNQDFKITTQGETDWGYVMRVAAIQAQEAF